MSTKWIFVIWLLSWTTTSDAQQSNLRLGTLPAINLNKKLSHNINANLKLETRQIHYNGQSWTSQYDRTDLSLLLSRKTGLSSILASGYMLRRTDGQSIHRLIQQFTLVQDFSTFRLAHRFGADQTFGRSLSFQSRFRYRISAQLPLSGDIVDPSEFYIKLQNEYLNIIGDGYDFEVRIIAMLGYQFSDRNKVEFGFDNRFNEFINNSTQTRSWVALSWYIAL